MKLQVFRHLWGLAEPEPEAAPLEQIKAGGYDGIEAVLPADEYRKVFLQQLREHNLQFISQFVTSGVTVEEHVAAFRHGLEQASLYKPLKVVCHSGLDAWAQDDVLQFYEQALKLEAEFGIVVAHETHRGRPFFNPWATYRTLQALPEIKLCCDFSHWACVAERMLPEDDAAMQLAYEHCIHIHARVGYEEGPQVPEPRAPEYAGHLAQHEKWWDAIWHVQQKRGDVVSTLTPEFGPPAYMHTLPYNNEPVADLAAICDWQAERQRQRFAERVI